MKKIIFILTVTSLLFSCGSDSSGPSRKPDNFDRSQLLTNWANQIIVPAINAFDKDLKDLQTAQQTFVNLPNEDHLLSLQNALFTAQKSWQYVAMFEFGKAEELSYRSFMNDYPIDFETSADSSIEDDNTIVKNLEAANLAIADINFSLPNRTDEQGFPVLDYMVNGLGANNTEIVSFYVNDNTKANYIEYQTKVIDRMVDLTNQVVDYWKTNTSSFIASTGSSATASFDKIVNDYLNYTEQAFRERKIAAPSGKRNGIPAPNKVESFYSADHSKALFLEAYKAVKNMYLGTGFTNNTNGVGLDDYLVDVDATVFDTTERVTKSLDVLIKEKFLVIDAQIAKLDDNFITQINNDNAEMLTAFNEIQNQVLLIKVNGFECMNVIVDFVDGDGD